MVTASLISRLSQAVDQIEQRLQQNRPLKVVTVCRGWTEPADVALDRHYARRPEDRGANVVIFKFCNAEDIADEGQDCTAPAKPAFGEP
jgi:hypothetical protein